MTAENRCNDRGFSVLLAAILGSAVGESEVNGESRKRANAPGSLTLTSGLAEGGLLVTISPQPETSDTTPRRPGGR